MSDRKFHICVTNSIVKCDKSHCLSSLSQMFEVLANNVKLVKVLVEDNVLSAAAENTNSILNELKLAHKHLVFNWMSVGIRVKCSDIVASINVKEVTPQLVTSVLDRLRDTLPIYGLHLHFATVAAAGLI